jgi:hypothetical protein
LHAFRKQECALELARGDAAVEKYPLLVVNLAAANDELALLKRDFELILRKAGYGECNPQAFGRAVGLGQPFDIVRGISVRSAAGHAIQCALDIVKAQKKRRIQTRYA